MRLDFNETNILVRALDELGRSSKKEINKTRLEEALYALGLHTDRELVILRISVKSLIKKLEGLSEEDIANIVLDNKNNKIVATVCYQLPDSKSKKS